MQKLLNFFFKTTEERIKNPFIGSYIICFFAYNWRAILLLIFSDAKIEDKIVVINNEYCSKTAIFYPIGIALFYVLILPYLNLIFDYVLTFSYTKKVEKMQINIINNLKHKKAEAKYEREIADERTGTTEVYNLKNKIDALENENSLKSDELISSSEVYKEKMSKLQIEYEGELNNKNYYKREYDSIFSNTVNMQKIYDLLLDESELADRKIKIFLKTYLNVDEIYKMKDSLEENYLFEILPYRPEVNSLLIKIYIYKYNPKYKNYENTEYGKKFIHDID